MELINAVNRNNIDEVGELVFFGGVDLDFKGGLFNETALIHASRMDYVEIARILIDGRANLDIPDMNGNTALIMAARNGHDEIARILIDGRANLNSADVSGNTALIHASRMDYVEIARILIDGRANLDIPDMNGNTALIMAARNGHDEIARILIDGRANLNSADVSGNTALIWAADMGHDEIARILIENGANLDLWDNVGDTALIVATRKGNDEIARILIENGADLNIQNEGDGSTALIEAVRTDRLRPVERVNIARMLIDNGADIHIQDKDGDTAYGIAEEIGRVDIFDQVRRRRLAQSLAALSEVDRPQSNQPGHFRNLPHQLFQSIAEALPPEQQHDIYQRRIRESRLPGYAEAIRDDTLSRPASDSWAMDVLEPPPKRARGDYTRFGEGREWTNYGPQTDLEPAQGWQTQPPEPSGGSKSKRKKSKRKKSKRKYYR